MRAKAAGGRTGWRRWLDELAVRGGALLFHILGRTTRYADNLDETDGYRGAKHEALICAVWHGRFFPLVFLCRGRGICVVTSRSNDGRMLSRVLGRMGFVTVAGSSTRGGSRALIDVARRVKSGADAAIAPDGPRGPAEQAKAGIVLLSKLTGRPIVPTATAYSCCWQFQSWDRFRVPLPLSRIAVSFGPPMSVAPDADNASLEQHRVRLERTLKEMQEQVDAAMGGRVLQWPGRRGRRSA